MTAPTEQTRPGTDRPAGAASRMVDRWGTRGTVVISVLSAIVLLAVGAIIGVLLTPGTTAAPVNSAAVTPGTVDIGFSQDMVVHHTQGVSMANLAQLDTSDPEIRTVAFDIGSTQQTDIGEMDGWLDLWGRPRTSDSAAMSWMGGMVMVSSGAAPAGSADSTSGMAGMSGGAMSGMAGASTAAVAGNDGAVMPGMATNTELTKLRSLRGTASDIFFLQLMIRHHEGGASMMTYAGEHATVPYVRTFAQKMVAQQGQEISLMTQMLTARGAAPLPFSASAMR